MYGPDVFATNCLFTGVSNIPLTANSPDSYSYGGGGATYHPTGAGGYYLTNTATSLHNAGTTSIDPGLLADLQTLTTEPPTILPTYITTHH